MPSRLFQSVINQMRSTMDRNVGVVDESGTVIACSELTQVGNIKAGVVAAGVFSGDQVCVDNVTYKAFGTYAQAEYAVFVDGTDTISKRYADIIAVSLEQIRDNSDEKFDRASFVKNVILENILLGDIYLKSRDLHFDNSVSRAVLIIRSNEEKEISVYDVVQNFFPDKTKDFVVSVNETDVVLVKETRAGITYHDLEKLARSICDSLMTEFYCNVTVGIGTTVVGIKDLSKSFREAQVALEVGKVFDTEKQIVSYEHLGIARLIYQLPTTLCEMFLGEVFQYGSIEMLDQETLFTIQKFFENNLNVSETSRKLFVHRNTLVYRLEKIKKITGLDLREFDDAIVFKVALMVHKYLKTNPTKY